MTGDAVNVAARLEQSADTGEILIGEDTYSLVKDAVHAEPTEPLLLRGKAERRQRVPSRAGPVGRADLATPRIGDGRT